MKDAREDAHGRGDRPRYRPLALRTPREARTQYSNRTIGRTSTLAIRRLQCVIVPSARLHGYTGHQIIPARSTWSAAALDFNMGRSTIDHQSL